MTHQMTHHPSRTPPDRADRTDCTAPRRTTRPVNSPCRCHSEAVRPPSARCETRIERSAATLFLHLPLLTAPPSLPPPPRALSSTCPPGCVDELIRQVTINCAERGLLLLRVRDEIRMTIAAYQTLYESSVAFGMRKALQAEQGKADMEQMIADLQSEKKNLEGQLAAMKAKCDEIERRETERRAVEERKHTEELQLHKRTNQQLKAQLESILAPAKK